MRETLKSGDKVIYHHEHRGGYGYVTHHPAVVVKILPKRVRICVARINRENGETYAALVNVTPNKLTSRSRIETYENILESKS